MEMIKLKQESSKKTFSNKQQFGKRLISLLEVIYAQKDFKQLLSQNPILQQFVGRKGDGNESIPKTKEALTQQIFKLAFEAQTVFFNTQSRVDNGVYYTPSEEIRPMTKKLAATAVASVCEPACGTGLLTLTYIDEYLSKYKKAPKIRCFDIAEEAVALTKIFLNALLYIKIGAQSIKQVDVRIECADISMGPFPNEKFDLVLMNPPYVKGAQKFLKKKQDEIMDFGTGNLTNVFMSYALNRLSENGKGLFVLGEPVKWGNSYRGIIERIYQNYSITDYKHSLGKFDSIQYEVFGIAVEKEKVSKVRRQTVGRRVGTLAVNLSPEDESVLGRMIANSKPLSEFTQKCTRGIYVKKDYLRPGTTFISSGTEMNAYHSQAVFGLPKSEVQWKDIFDTERLIIKAKRGKLMHASICDAGIATTDNIVNLSPKNTSLPLMMAYLNSAAASYFLTEAIFCGNSESARILDGIYLEKLPFPELSAWDKKKIEKLSEMVFGKVNDYVDENYEVWHLELGRDAKKIGNELLNLPVNEALREIDNIFMRSFGIDSKSAEKILARYGRILTHKKSQKRAA